MAWFEVFIPAKDTSLPNVTLTVEAPNWIGALRTGLSNLGEGHDAIANVMCDIKEDNSIHVTDVQTRRVFRLREVPQPGAAKAPPSSSLAPENTAPAPRSPSPPPVTMPEGRPQPPAPAHTKTQQMHASAVQPPKPPPAPPPAPPPMAARPVSMPDIPRDALDEPLPDDGGTIPNPMPAMAPTETQGGAPLDASIPWTKMPAPQAQQKTEPAAPPPPPPAPPAPASKQAPATRPVTAPVGFDNSPPTTAEVPKKKAPSPAAAEPTERVPRASVPPSGPVNAPTPRGTPAPPPKRITGQFEAAPQPVSRQESKPTPSTSAPIGRNEPIDQAAVADAVADVFDATQDLLLEGDVDPKAVAEKLLDIALQYVPAESGSFYLADVNGHELLFAAVRGPKASEIQKKKLSVKVGQGIVGFCALEGVCLSVSDIQRDPRYYSAVADAVGYSPKDTICASAEKDGRLFGAVQLINSRGGFTPVHMEVLRYIGLTAASLLERHFDTH